MVELIKSDIGIYLAYIISIVALLHLAIIYFVLRKDIIKHLKGNDGEWSLKDLSAIAWLVIAPTIITCNVLGVTIQHEVWWSLDVWYMANLGSNNLDNYVNKRYGDKSSTDEGSKTVNKDKEKESEIN